MSAFAPSLKTHVLVLDEAVSPSAEGDCPVASSVFDILNLVLCPSKCISEASLDPAQRERKGDVPKLAFPDVPIVSKQAYFVTKLAFEADEAGLAPQGTPIAETGPAAYLSTLPLRRVVTDLRAAGVPADISGDAGTRFRARLASG